MDEPARWLHPAQTDPDARVRLFVFHHSGGNAAMYRQWVRLPTDITGQCVQLPGRQERRHERPYDRLAPLVDALADVLGAELDGRPYALAGHSLGALLSYRVAVALARRGERPPALVAASGWAPGRDAASGSAGGPRLDPGVDDAGIVETMRRLGGLPPRLGADPDVLAWAVPAMRADLAVCADYRDDGARLDSPIVAYSGRDDPLAPPTAMRAWADRTRAGYLGNRQFPGRHFFAAEHALDIVTDLVHLLRRIPAPH
jgi:surfactin synthase thioesterase subunit